MCGWEGFTDTSEQRKFFKYDYKCSIVNDPYCRRPKWVGHFASEFLWRCLFQNHANLS